MATPQNPAKGMVFSTQLRDRTIEQWTEIQIDLLIDPETPEEERQRRIHRLTEGPPEFVTLRTDLPRNKNR